MREKRSKASFTVLYLKLFCLRLRLTRCVPCIPAWCPKQRMWNLLRAKYVRSVFVFSRSASKTDLGSDKMSLGCPQVAWARPCAVEMPCCPEAGRGEVIEINSNDEMAVVHEEFRPVKRSRR